MSSLLRPPLVLLINRRIRTILDCIGEDPNREGLVGTPAQYAEAMLYFTKGYEENLKDIVRQAVFQEDHEEMGKQTF